MTPPLLTIAIPTWNRADYLALGLAQLRDQLSSVDAACVEIVVSDNCSPDHTPAVVHRAQHAGMPIQYVRNAENLGWARNFVQAFELSQGAYVLLMGDDDVLVDGALPLLLNRLRRDQYGVVCLRPYGFDNDFRAEYPGSRSRERAFRDPNEFLRAISRYFTLTSANVINKSLLADVDVRQFVDTNLATFHLLLRAALAGRQNLFLDRYLVASKRQNSFAYEYSDVFVREMWRIIDAHVPYGLTTRTVRSLERQKMLAYYPFYLLDLRLANRGDLARARSTFEDRFGTRLLYRCWLEPVLTLPRAPAILWGGITTAIGRVVSGDLRRGIAFAVNRIRSVVQRHRSQVRAKQRTSES